jgi:hypothetical protein
MSSFLGCALLAGQARSRSEGTRIGRPRVAIDIKTALELRRQGLGYKQIAKQLGVPRTTVYRTLKAIPQPPLKNRTRGYSTTPIPRGIPETVGFDHIHTQLAFVTRTP